MDFLLKVVIWVLSSGITMMGSMSATNVYFKAKRKIDYEKARFEEIMKELNDNKNKNNR